MSRYFLELAYDGTDFCGWQKQTSDTTVQETIENKLSILLNNFTPIVGCGRTDTGVHASQYFCHFDTKKIIDNKFLYQLNAILPSTISIRKYFPTPLDSHARFDALERTYKYLAHGNKNPFKERFSTFIPNLHKLDILLMNQLANFLLTQSHFYPFCKSNSDVKTMECKLYHCQWTKTDDYNLVFEITANRFLRGMVRLIVGACINFAQGKINMNDIQISMEKQMVLRHSWSAPAQGLFLTKIKYPKELCSIDISNS